LPDTLQQFREECTEALKEALKTVFSDWADKVPRLTIPPTGEFGELSSSIAHDIARQIQLAPNEVAHRIKEAIDTRGKSLIAAVEDVGGYVNFRLNYSIAGTIVLEAALRENETFGVERVQQPLRISVEHTSANPSGPLTMGHARNAILGDALARILKARGHIVNRRFYVDDAGRQVAILAYGYSLLREPKPQGKSDYWFGRLYACTNCALQIETTKKKLEQLGASTEQPEQRLTLQRQLDEWIGIAAELESTDKELLNQVLTAIQDQPDPEQAVQELGRKYEQNDKDVAVLVRKVSNLCLEGIKVTLSDMDIEFDTWDWESQVLWDGEVDKILPKLRSLPFAHSEGLSVSLDVNAIVNAFALREEFKLSPTYEVPPLTLARSDGTTLYPTRDIAYTMVKFKDSDKVINVIATEQSLPQLQIRLALYALGERETARNLIHYAYGLVELPGVKMSKRRARYVALDDVLQQAKARVKETIGGRKEELGGTESDEIVRSIALGATRFTMLNINSAKNLTFTWDRVLSLERNSAPFINYAYTRAGSIIRKLGEIPEKANLTLLNHSLEHLLILKVAQLPEVFREAADQLKPEDLAGYANSVAEKFHEYYEKVDVIHSDEQVKNARALLVRAVQIVLRNSMELLGIRVSERM
jgi:arginyl-tRNA synthetase